MMQYVWSRLYDIARETMRLVNQLDMYEWAAVGAVLLLLGIFCMRGLHVRGKA